MSWPEFWQRRTPVSHSLVPLSGLYGQVMKRRYRQRSKELLREAVPVIVVGNIVVGGSGKTPFIHWLVMHLQSMGHRPGIISRGYGGASTEPRRVVAHDRAGDVGDEPLLLQRLTGVPVWVGRNRPAVANALLQDDASVDVVISDDGLQHYALPRSLEICLFDGAVGAGNGRLLPAGPLREPWSRLSDVDLIVAKGEPAGLPANTVPQSVMRLSLGAPIPVSTHPSDQPGQSAGLPTPEQTTEQSPVAVVCGIGQPQSFYRLLEAQGWVIEPCSLPDHGVMTASLKQALAGRTVLMTSKDAVKLAGERLPFDAYEVPLTVSFSTADEARITRCLAPLFTLPSDSLSTTAGRHDA